MAKLRADLGDEAVARDLAARLSRWEAPAVDPRDTARLLEHLRPELPQPERFSLLSRLARWWPGLLLRSQLRVVRGEIWAGSTLVMTLGALVTLASLEPGAADALLPFLLTAPVVTALGVAFLYGPANDPAFELELAAPISPRLILLARLALLFGFDLGLGLAASLIISLAGADLPLWPLVLTWLAPMTFLSALAFLISVLSTDPTPAMLLSLLLWVSQILRRFPVGLDFLPDLLARETQPALWLGAAALGGLAVWLGGRQERWLVGQPAEWA